MSKKSFVSLEQNVCSCCGHAFDTGAILMHKRLVEKFDNHTVTGWGMCPTCGEHISNGFVALVGINNDPGGSTVKQEQADRSGRLAFLRLEAFNRIFNVGAPEGGVCFVENAVLDKLEEMQQRAPE